MIKRLSNLDGNFGSLSWEGSFQRCWSSRIGVLLWWRQQGQNGNDERKLEEMFHRRAFSDYASAVMETLGLSDSTPRAEGRLKSLLWPDIQTGTDVDYLGTQGYWICTLIAVLSFIFLVLVGSWIGGTIVLLFCYLSGIGVRERSRYAASVVFLAFAADTVVAGFGIVRIIVGALLLSNCRATWIASEWNPSSEEAILPPRLSDTWGDKFSDKFPQWLWPKVRIPYYVFSACVLLLALVGAWTHLAQTAASQDSLPDVLK